MDVFVPKSTKYLVLKDSLHDFKRNRLTFKIRYVIIGALAWLFGS